MRFIPTRLCSGAAHQLLMLPTAAAAARRSCCQTLHAAHRAAVAPNSPDTTVGAAATGGATEMIVGGGGSPRRLADCIVCNTRVARSACVDDPGTTAVPAGLLLAAVVVMATAAEDEEQLSWMRTPLLTLSESRTEYRDSECKLALGLAPVRKVGTQKYGEMVRCGRGNRRRRRTGRGLESARRTMLLDKCYCEEPRPGDAIATLADRIRT